MLAILHQHPWTELWNYMACKLNVYLIQIFLVQLAGVKMTCFLKITASSQNSIQLGLIIRNKTPLLLIIEQKYLFRENNYITVSRLKCWSERITFIFYCTWISNVKVDRELLCVLFFSNIGKLKRFPEVKSRGKLTLKILHDFFSRENPSHQTHWWTESNLREWKSYKDFGNDVDIRRRCDYIWFWQV